jgi:hypothetical protein
VVDEKDRLRRIRQLEAEQATALAKAEAENLPMLNMYVTLILV